LKISREADVLGEASRVAHTEGKDDLLFFESGSDDRENRKVRRFGFDLDG
jgi:hypothetical protein